MKKLALFLAILFTFGIGYAQTSDTTQIEEQSKYEKQEKPQKTKGQQLHANKVFFGGSLGLSFGSYTSIRVYPMIGYKITPKLSVGTKFMYEYAKNNRQESSLTYNNYGMSVFGRYRIIHQIYAHAEYNYMNYEGYRLNNENYRYAVPYLFLGGGFVQRIGSNSYAYAEILFDVLNDTNSPYAEYTPFYSVGVSVGF